jgi:hypothetical protein
VVGRGWIAHIFFSGIAGLGESRRNITSSLIAARSGGFSVLYCDGTGKAPVKLFYIEKSVKDKCIPEIFRYGFIKACPFD